LSHSLFVTWYQSSRFFIQPPPFHSVAALGRSISVPRTTLIDLRFSFSFLSRPVVMQQQQPQSIHSSSYFVSSHGRAPQPAVVQFFATASHPLHPSRVFSMHDEVGPSSVPGRVVCLQMRLSATLRPHAHHGYLSHLPSARRADIPPPLHLGSSAPICTALHRATTSVCAMPPHHFS